MNNKLTLKAGDLAVFIYKSIYLTLYLSIQRLVAMNMPLKADGTVEFRATLFAVIRLEFFLYTILVLKNEFKK